MSNIDNLYKYLMVHPDVAKAYVDGDDVAERILINEVPDVSLMAFMEWNREPKTFITSNNEIFMTSDGKNFMTK